LTHRCPVSAVFLYINGFFVDKTCLRTGIDYTSAKARRFVSAAPKTDNAANDHAAKEAAMNKSRFIEPASRKRV
jgi:hypothetical protein